MTTANNTSGPIIHTVEGPVQGVIDDSGVVAYKGIPYAAPPVGNLRWRPPHAVTPWTQTLLPNEETSSCLQDRQFCIAFGGGDPHPMSEDCLYLNVWTPQPQAGATKLPVMVWIHGGAYIMGAGKLPVYHGAPLVKRGAILVTVNYRLGALGFFAHDALDKERIAEGAPHVNNFGLLDQIAALEWVQRNIEKFGGDADNVTIFGQSAGSRSVLALFASPLVKQREKRLFHRGIAQSVYRNPDASQEQAHKRGAKLAGLLLGLADGSTATVEQLRGIDAERLMNVNKEFSKKQLEGTSNSPVAITGDSVLPNLGGVIDSFLKGEAAELPLIIGNTGDDGSVVLDVEGIYPITIIGMAPEDRIGPPRYYYPDLANVEDIASIRTDLGHRLARDAFFTVTTYKIAMAHSKRAPVWRYYFDYTPENLRDKVTFGTRHGDDVGFTMNTLDIARPFPPGEPQNPVVVTDKDREVASRVSEYWFEFGRTGVPSSSTGPEWPQHAEGQDRTLVVGETIEVREKFMQQHFGKPPVVNMVAFDETGKVADGILNPT
ncbi:carboxylesterase/lipase family protein [Sorangium sp. So ce1078]|uniref:carboxylesterase/lipase family protein n=1 Tax=Sorangium sp. So ce1078 TaxID=3133329 RepID=UPI003F62BBDC